jgi:hypothetical protein
MTYSWVTVLKADHHGGAADAADHRQLRDRWRAVYGPDVAEALESDTRYSLVRVGEVDYAYTDYDAYVRALGQIWAAGLVADHCTGALGTELLDAAPNLRGVDLDLADMNPADGRAPVRAH